MRVFGSSVLIGWLLICDASAAKRDKNHIDAFMPGPVDENELSQEVRHQLITLPYYGVFDDLLFGSMEHRDTAGSSHAAGAEVRCGERCQAH